ncbi:MAG: redoxin domain-containing protein [Promethearchaeota archaeon]|nr:MAG: redoxin domain-containing protein [Candidatus Lokiarchaeota archaeon]
MGRLAYRYEEFVALDTEIYPILVDTVENAKIMENKYAKNKFAIYYDEENTVAKQLQQESKWYKLGRMPGLLIIDKESKVQYAYYGNNMADIPKNGDVLEVLTLLNP